MLKCVWAEVKIHKERQRQRVSLSHFILTSLILCVYAFWWGYIVQPTVS